MVVAGNYMEEDCGNDPHYLFPFQEIDEIEQITVKRPNCLRCKRPERVCVCFAFPKVPVPITTTLHILQHPREQDFRQLTTVPLLQECISKDKCVIYRGKRFPKSKFAKLHEVCAQTNTAVLYPAKDAVDIKDFVAQLDGEPLQLIVLDGTWQEARAIGHNCSALLKDIPKVKITGSWRSEFVIKTQPTDESVSTLEAVAIALSQIEQMPDFITIARKPLKALCDFQIQHGAQIHESKESLARKGIKYRIFEKKF